MDLEKQPFTKESDAFGKMGRVVEEVIDLLRIPHICLTMTFRMRQHLLSEGMQTPTEMCPERVKQQTHEITECYRVQEQTPCASNSPRSSFNHHLTGRGVAFLETREGEHKDHAGNLWIPMGGPSSCCHLGATA